MRKRENRAATMEQIVEATDVPEELLLKFIKSGRIQVKQFPNLGYPCDKCGVIIQTGKLCESCATELRKEIDLHEKEEQRKEELRKQNQRTYLSKKIICLKQRGYLFNGDVLFEYLKRLTK